MADEEERALEEQLEVQLEEQKDALRSLTEALSSDPSDSELLSVCPQNLGFSPLPPFVFFFFFTLQPPSMKLC